MVRTDERADMATVAAALAERMADLAVALVGTEPTQRDRLEWRFRSRGSLAVVVAGPKRGAWHDHEAGAGGDTLGLVAHLRREAMRRAWDWALAWLGWKDGTDMPLPFRPASAPPVVHRGRGSGTLDLARSIWAEAVLCAGTLAEWYLMARGIRLPPDAPLRFHPACPRGPERWPALLALMTDPVFATPCGVHRTFIMRDGSGKAPPGARGEPAKMMAGAAGVVRLVPDEAVTLGLGVAEGLETSLAVMQAFGWRPVWAATSAGAICTFPVLAGIEALTVFADPDGAGMAAAESCAARWSAAGREARICTPPQGDFNDLARSRPP